MHHHRHTAATESERGASLVEYALLLALIAVVALAALSFLGTATAGRLTKSRDCIEAAYDGKPKANCN